MRNPSVLATGATTADQLDDLARAELEPVPGARGPILKRSCFVTVGSSKAGFRQLLQDISDPAFLRFLVDSGYGELTVQCGPDLAWFEERLKDTDTSGLEVEYFDFTSNIKEYFLSCRGEYKSRLAGVVIAHCGSGTVLDVRSVEAPLIVVVNPTLLDNHQQELAETIDEQRWGVLGRLGHLQEAVRESRHRVAQGRLDDLPPYEEPAFPPADGDRSTTLFDWMVLTCYPDAMAKAQQLRDLDDLDREPVGGLDGAAAPVPVPALEPETAAGLRLD